MPSGKPAGATTANQDMISKPGEPVSATVGTSGNKAERSAESKAMGCSVPARMCGNEATMVSTAKGIRSEEHTSELQSLMRISYAVFCLKKKKKENIKREKKTKTEN